MSNLSDLLPAGAGGKQVDFVASGTLGSGQVVVLRSDGKVEAVDPAGGPAAPGESAIFEFNDTYSVSSAYDPGSNTVVVVYADNTSGFRGEAVVGTISGSSISFGTPVTFYSGYTLQINVGFAGAGKVVVAYTAEGASYTGRVKVGTVSGTSISFGGETEYSSANAGYPTFAWDSNSNRIVIFFKGSVDRGTARVGSVGSSVSFGSEVQFQTDGAYGFAATFDSNLNKVVVFYRDGSQWGRAKVGTVSGTSISFGSEATFLSGSAQPCGAVFDTSSNKIVLAYIDYTNSQYGTAKVCTVSGTSISFGSAIVFKSASTNMVTNGTAAVYDSNANKTTIGYSTSTVNTSAILGTVSGTSISFASDTVVSTSTAAPSCAYNSNQNTVVMSYRNIEGDGESTLFKATTSTAQNFIGITDAAISDTASGSVTIKGGISTNVTGLTANSTYYVQSDGTLSTTASDVLAGKALSSTSINLDYTT